MGPLFPLYAQAPDAFCISLLHLLLSTEGALGPQNADGVIFYVAAVLKNLGASILVKSLFQKPSKRTSFRAHLRMLIEDGEKSLRVNSPAFQLLSANLSFLEITGLVMRLDSPWMNPREGAHFPGEEHPCVFAANINIGKHTLEV